MGKPAKSSASSGTRKKHARKANPQDPPLQIEKKAKGKGKKTAKNEPKIKSYIPPPKYQALQRDPVDVLGLTSILPPELIVILRRFMKRDAVTRRRALEEFQTQWIDKCLPSGSRDEDQSERISILELALPVWVRFLYHLLSKLFVLIILCCRQAIFQLYLSILRGVSDLLLLVFKPQS